jgi:hypothetical protein
VESIDVPALETKQFSASHAGEAAEEHEASEPGLDRFGELENRRRVEHRSFVGMLDAGSPDGARVAVDQPIGKGGIPDRPQQSVALGRLVSREFRGLGVPLAHTLGRDLPQSCGSEGRVEVTPEQGPVAMGGGRSERPTLHQSLAYPDLGEFAEEPLPTFRVVDESREFFTFHLRTEGFCVLTGQKRSGASDPVDAETHVVADTARVSRRRMLAIPTVLLVCARKDPTMNGRLTPSNVLRRCDGFVGAPATCTDLDGFDARLVGGVRRPWSGRSKR